MTNFLRITAATAVIVLCTVLPFLPGPYDSLAVPLSGMSQLFGKVGLQMDVLQLTPEELALDQSRGHYAVHDASHPYWKYFWFD